MIRSAGDHSGESIRKTELSRDRQGAFWVLDALARSLTVAALLCFDRQFNRTRMQYRAESS